MLEGSRTRSLVLLGYGREQVSSISVLLVDDQPIVRLGLRAILREIWPALVVTEVADGLTAVDAAARIRPDLAILGDKLPRLSGREAAQQILARPETKRPRIMIFSSDAQAYRVRSAFRLGVMGYVRKDATCEELKTAIRTVFSGGKYLSPTAAGDLLRQVGADDPDAASGGAIERLTPREREVLALLAEGKTSKEMAATLLVSHKTVEAHRTQIMSKLRVFSVAELTKVAVRAGLTPLGV